jgi:hypothetical protein
MTMQSLIERVSQLAQAIEQSAANHNALVGRLAEAKSILDMLNSVKVPGTVGTVISDADAALGTTENVVNAVSGAIAPSTTPAAN